MPARWGSSLRGTAGGETCLAARPRSPAFALLAYANSFHTPFLVDNADIILKDTRIHAVTPIGLHRILTEQYWETGQQRAVSSADHAVVPVQLRRVGQWQRPLRISLVQFPSATP